MTQSLIPNGFRPLLAATPKDLTVDLRFPLYASAKLDGVRAVSWGGVLYSRTLKPIPNVAVQDRYRFLPNGTDGELIVGAPNAPDVFRNTTSCVMTIKGSDDCGFFAFDNALYADIGFKFRVGYLSSRELCAKGAQWVEQITVHTLPELLDLETSTLAHGYEGLVLRDPHGRYKYGRSTVLEGIMLKLKRFVDAEAEIIGWEPLYTNANAQVRDERGYAKRSSHQGGLMAQELLGALHVRLGTVAFNIGSGFTEAERRAYWTTRETLLGQLVRFKYLTHGVKDAPRHPIYLGLRSKLDV